MIQFIEGTIEDINEGSVVIDHGGMGFEIMVPQTVIEGLPAIGSTIRMYTHFHVREDAIQLFGFLNRDDRTLFRQLITVSGIGPKGALGILSVMSADDVRFAVLADDAKAIAKAPGIGVKTAGKLILELKDKLLAAEVVNNALSRGEAIYEGIAASGNTKMVSEAVEALSALGYSSTEAMKAVNAVGIKEDMTVEELLKLSLKQM